MGGHFLKKKNPKEMREKKGMIWLTKKKKPGGEVT